MLPTTKSYYSATNPHGPSHRPPWVTTIDRGQEKRPPAPSETRLVASTERSSEPWTSPSPAALELAPCLRDPIPVPAADTAALLFLLPALSLVHPALYLSASIIVLHTPARSSASLLAPPLSPTATTTPTTSAALTPRGTRRRRMTGRWRPSPHRCHPCRPEREGV
jgi:hypothetical protein